jgi:hypothetical protein
MRRPRFRPRTSAAGKLRGRASHNVDDLANAARCANGASDVSLIVAEYLPGRTRVNAYAPRAFATAVSDVPSSATIAPAIGDWL